MRETSYFQVLRHCFSTGTIFYIEKKNIKGIGYKNHRWVVSHN